MQQYVVSEDGVVDELAFTPEKELIIHDKETKLEMAKIVVREQFCLKGVWFEVVKVAEDEITLKPKGYTGKKLKRMAREAKLERDRKQQRMSPKLANKRV